jgi:hypothetical protein
MWNKSTAAILPPPATPTELYNAIVAKTVDWSRAYLETEAHSADYLAKSLDAYTRREARAVRQRIRRPHNRRGAS